MQHVIFRIILCAFLFLTAGQALAQKTDNALVFDPFPRGPKSTIVDKAWMAIPEYKKHYDFFQMLPDYMIASTDLNKDGSDEIFARHSSEEAGFCDMKGITCLMHIYTVKDGMIVEIGKTMAGSEIIPLETSQNGFKDLLIKNKDDALDLYRFNGTSYAKGTGK